MSIYRASFGAWFSRSALLNIRGTGLAWLMYIFGLVDSLLYTAGDDRDMALFWSVFATVIIGQQFSVFLHRLTAGVESSLIPGYRRSQWRVFIAMSAMAMIACAAPFYLLGLAPAGAIGIAMLVF
ncbi:MAG TPA: hypothetical protein VFK45_00125, partial [Gammaproteobacteria bacterium]|nr:hypothetical protein [Gammaproteobacteria bacterium]